MKYIKLAGRLKGLDIKRLVHTPPFFRTEDLNTEYEHSERIEITDMKEIVCFFKVNTFHKCLSYQPYKKQILNKQETP